MAKGKRFNSVKEMLKSVSDSPDRAKNLEKELDDAFLSKTLFIVRNKIGLTQEQLAKKIGWSQSQVSKLEHQKDEKFTIEDLTKYCSGVGLSIEIALFERGQTWFDLLKFHFSKMTHYLNKISASAKGDETIQKGVNSVMRDATINLMKLVSECLTRIEMPKSTRDLHISGPYLEDETNMEGTRRTTSELSSTER